MAKTILRRRSAASFLSPQDPSPRDLYAEVAGKCESILNLMDSIDYKHLEHQPAYQQLDNAESHLGDALACLRKIKPGPRPEPAIQPADDSSVTVEAGDRAMPLADLMSGALHDLCCGISCVRVLGEALDSEDASAGDCEQALYVAIRQLDAAYSRLDLAALRLHRGAP